MYPPRFTTNDDVAHAKAAVADLFNAMGKGLRKLRAALTRRHAHAEKTAQKQGPDKPAL